MKLNSMQSWLLIQNNMWNNQKTDVRSIIYGIMKQTASDYLEEPQILINQTPYRATPEPASDRAVKLMTDTYKNIDFENFTSFIRNYEKFYSVREIPEDRKCHSVKEMCKIFGFTDINNFDINKTNTEIKRWSENAQAQHKLDVAQGLFAEFNRVKKYNFETQEFEDFEIEL